MKNKKQIRKTKQHRRSPAPAIFTALVLVVCLFFGWTHLQACMTHLCPAEIYLPDLPKAFDGTRLLFVSDLKLQSEKDTQSVKRLMNRLARIDADILLLGGDYGADSTLEAINGASSTGTDAHVADFIASLSDFPAPMGKFAVAGDQDGDPRGLSEKFKASGVQCLADNYVKIQRNGSEITIAGLSDRSYGRDGSAKLCRGFKNEDFVIVMAHNPASYIDARVAEAKNGGTWADLMLSGHTLGGQISVFGRTLRSFTEEERRTMAGWYYPDDLPLLVSQGLGCEDIKLRLGSESQVHLITLRRQEVLP